MYSLQRDVHITDFSAVLKDAFLYFIYSEGWIYQRVVRIRKICAL